MNKNKVSVLILCILVSLSPTLVYSYEKIANVDKSNVCLSATKTNKSNENSMEINFPSKISKVFPDPVLAKIVAEKLKKNVDGIVTKKELAGIKGEFDCHPGDMAILTGIGYLTGITSLNCYKNNVTTIPAEIGKLTNLEALDFCKAFSVKNIPPEIGKLRKLKYIRFGLNQLESIPKEIGNLINLQFLMLSNNNIRSIPKEIGNLKKLETLDIHSTGLTSVPESISNLTNLIELDISHNNLTQLPKNIGNLKKLKTFNLFNNKLTSIPASIGNMLELTDLNVFDNYKLNENYKKYLPKRHDIKLEVSLGKSCIITLPFSNRPKNSIITYDFKRADETNSITPYIGMYYSYYDYVNIKPEILKNNKVKLNSNLFKKKGSYIFRIVVKNKNSGPAFNVYKWSIIVK
ncbi:MAG: leucine-rich repeat domain-containing protein [Clostridium sp.]|uniref:leucine-rich repeat domain-containing protein n=1 Tax=Clostridium sp. TaxID=1506 RepID=UPI003D6C8053